MEIHAAAQDPLPFQGCWASHGENQDGEACVAQAWCAEGSTTSFLVEIMFICEQTCLDIYIYML